MVDRKINVFWTFFQVYKTSLSFYINGVRPGFLPVETFVLGSQVKDSAQGQSRIGQSITG